ncbi:MAG: isoleucine--tRNA ligase [Alphaproteobacteria bacterium]|nr:isoleucine--tRNA ligase [Alphaproteobacteria bacterium]
MSEVKKLKDTIFLPKTSFPMQGNLAKNDPILVQYWQNTSLYKELRKRSKNKKKFMLHFGPPYANGPIHMGHALTGILKDTINKCYQMMGYDAPLVLGWDCHGLPIEWKIEESYIKAGKKREEIPVVEFMSKCREYAAKWREIQKDGFRDLGIIFDYDNPYCTMDKSSEAAICEEFFKIVKQGYVHRDRKPVMWSVVEKTALAEAELEYHDKTSDAIYVKYPIIKTNIEELKNAYAVIWTTTPWTIPASLAIAYNPEFKYVLIAYNNTKLLVAQCRLESFIKENNIETHDIIGTFDGIKLDGTVCNHPLNNLGFKQEIRLLPADYVTDDAGTGLVHTAPGHGLDDFYLGKKYGLSTDTTVNENGTLVDTLPYFKGERVFKVNPKVIEELQKVGNLLSASKIVHSYPHSWRSKSPLIFRTTTQWFISIDPIRQKLLKEIKNTDWYPSSFVNRIYSMVEKRPDWCISRQRIWGVPIALFIHKKTNEILIDDDVFNKVLDTFKTEGIEAWHSKPIAFFLGSKYNPEDYTKVTDTIEVWFDSGCSHRYVLENRPELTWPADLYFEGSDQHRGWFQSSLVESVLTSGRAPYKKVATNGFLLDKNGRKMSKSLGNVIAPTDITKKYGADVLRLWCINGDYSEDMRIGEEIITRNQDVYRRFRNTLRYLLGVLSEYDPNDDVPYDQLPLLEKFILNKLYYNYVLLKKAINKFDLQKFYTELHAFCANDLSAFYFDIRKDTIYCDSKDNVIRKASLTVMNNIFVCLVHWLAPVLSFTSEEAWQAYPLNEKKDSIHLQEFPSIPEVWQNDDIEKQGQFIQSIRKVINGAIEIERLAKTIGSSLEADIIIYTSDNKVYKELNKIDIQELAIVSSAKCVLAKAPYPVIVNEELQMGVIVKKSEYKKCDRCWKLLDSVKEYNNEYGTVNLCERCNKVVNE